MSEAINPTYAEKLETVRHVEAVQAMCDEIMAAARAGGNRFSAELSRGTESTDEDGWVVVRHTGQVEVRFSWWKDPS